MEIVVDTLCSVAGIRPADARLALLIVVDAMAWILPEQELIDLAESLPLELCILLLHPTSASETEPLAELALVDARTIELVCRLVAREAPTSVQAWVARYVAPRLSGLGMGSRIALQSQGSDAFGPVTLPEIEVLSAQNEPLRAAG